MDSVQDPYRIAVSAVEHARNTAELQFAVARLLDLYGLRHAVYHVMHLPGVHLLNPVLAFTYDRAWVEHYLKQGYADIDPVYKAGKVSILPVQWEKLDKRGARVKRFFDEAAEAGIGKNGISFPIRGPNGEQALFTVNSDASEREWRMRKHQIMRDLQLIAHHVHARFMQLHVPNYKNANVDLSRREQEVLKWAASGKTVDETASILGLADRTVESYMQSAKYKLGALTKTQAVAKALIFRLFEL